MIFLEGLRGHGKTYDAVKSHVIPALSSGRKIITNITGLNFPAIEKITGVPSDELEQLVRYIPSVDIPVLPRTIIGDTTGVYKNTVLIIDEIQNIYPADRNQLDYETRVFFSESRKHSVDIVLISQDFDNVHKFIRSLVEQRIHFLNRGPAGKLDSVLVSPYAARKEGDKTIWDKMPTYTFDLEQAIFDCYQSTQADAEFKSTLKDARVNIWNHKGLKYGLPAFLLLVAYAVYWLVSTFFSSGTVTERITQKQTNKNLSASKQELPQPLQSKNPLINIITNSQVHYIGSYNKRSGLIVFTFQDTQTRAIYQVMLSQADDLKFQLNTNFLEVTQNEKKFIIPRHVPLAFDGKRQH